jgi:hypothetical protein
MSFPLLHPKLTALSYHLALAYDFPFYKIKIRSCSSYRTTNMLGKFHPNLMVCSYPLGSSGMLQVKHSFTGELDDAAIFYG